MKTKQIHLVINHSITGGIWERATETGVGGSACLCQWDCYGADALPAKGGRKAQKIIHLKYKLIWNLLDLQYENFINFLFKKNFKCMEYFNKVI